MARQRLREHLERECINSGQLFRQNTAPAVTFRQQADWWIISLPTRKRRPVKSATISGWRDVFLAGGEAGLKSRETDATDEERQRLRSVVADLAMDNELLKAKIRQMEQNRPLAPWKSKA